MRLDIPHEVLEENKCLIVGDCPTPTDEYVAEMSEWIEEFVSLGVSNEELKDIIMCLMLNETGQRDKYYEKK